MFGESESESPRVPSPWDSLISTPPSPSSRSSSTSPSPLSIELIPRLVPEADEGNVEYKLQLLSPSPARFARLVTQLKWRLLEGGGQAYYELGVADSGALVGLPRAELEQSLETLEMMAGEIGASVIVVKEIEVPAVMAGIAASQTDKWNGERKRRLAPPGSEGSSTTVLTSTSTTETETEPSTTDFDDEDLNEMSSTVVLNGKRPGTAPYPISTHASSSVSLFSMNREADPDPADNADAEPDDEPVTQAKQQPSYIAIDLEIASVFKPRPMRARMQMHAYSHTLSGHAKTKRLKRIKHITHPDSTSDSEQDHPRANGKGKGHAHAHAADPAAKANTRRQTRDRKREEKRKVLLAYAAASTVPAADASLLSLEPVDSPVISASPSPGPVPFAAEDKFAHDPTPIETDALVSGLASLHVSMDDPVPSLLSCTGATTASPKAIPTPHLPDDDGDDDVFATPLTTAIPLMSTSGSKEQDGTNANGAGTGKAQSRLIVEALVVRKMSLDEAFLDFGGFALV